MCEKVVQYHHHQHKSLKLEVLLLRDERDVVDMPKLIPWIAYISWTKKNAIRNWAAAIRIIVIIIIIIVILQIIATHIHNYIIILITYWVGLNRGVLSA